MATNTPDNRQRVLSAGARVLHLHALHRLGAEDVGHDVVPQELDAFGGEGAVLHDLGGP